MTTSRSEVTCDYCGGPWTDRGFAHARTCYIETGHMTRAVAKRAKDARAQRKAESVKPAIELEDEA